MVETEIKGKSSELTRIPSLHVITSGAGRQGKSTWARILKHLTKEIPDLLLIDGDSSTDYDVYASNQSTSRKLEISEDYTSFDPVWEYIENEGKSLIVNLGQGQFTLFSQWLLNDGVLEIKLKPEITLASTSKRFKTDINGDGKPIQLNIWYICTADPQSLKEYQTLVSSLQTIQKKVQFILVFNQFQSHGDWSLWNTVAENNLTIKLPTLPPKEYKHVIEKQLDFKTAIEDTTIPTLNRSRMFIPLKELETNFKNPKIAALFS